MTRGLLETSLEQIIREAVRAEFASIFEAKVKPLLATAPTATPPLLERANDATKSRTTKATKGPASFIAKSCNGKLSPVNLVPTQCGDKPGRPRPVPRAPFVCSTYVSIEATCPATCAFKKETGCYVRAGATKRLSGDLDAGAKGLTADEVIRFEVQLIDKKYKTGVPQDGGRRGRDGRDLRLHVGGDITNDGQAGLLGAAAWRWRARGGGLVWTFTHSWRTVRRSAWGPDISVLASVERAEDIELARQQGYASAIVVDNFPSTKAFYLPGTTAKIIPCPAETGNRTCVECRLCLNSERRLARNTAIAFEAHGPGRSEVLVQLRRAKAGGRGAP